MPETPQKFFVTTPIYYVNARPHIGHAYTTIVADVLARRARTQGIDTYFLTGTDEHGQKIERSAQAAGIPPQQFADEVSASFSTLWQRMGITHDDFIRTTSARHKRGVQKLFRVLQENGKIDLKSYTGSYCVSDEAFVDLPAGAPCPDCGRALETVTEQNYFFKLSEYRQPLLDLIESNTLSIQPDSRRNEVLSFLCGGLKDLSISRTSFKWGIPVPGEAGNEETGHVIYVWLDALANYMTALGYGSEDDTHFQKFWPADLHIVGKEIIRFHCVYWPAFLLAAGLPLPKQVVAHGWLLFEESKMSKSRGNIVRTETILDAFGPLCPQPANNPAPDPLDSSQHAVILSEAKDPRISSSSAPQTTLKHHQDLFAADVLRYFLLREIPFGQDGSFSFDALVTRYNADLANGYGNLVSRGLNMIQQHYVEIPVRPNDASLLVLPAFTQDGTVERLGTQDVVNALTATVECVVDLFSIKALTSALKSVNEEMDTVNRYFSDNTPWILAKSQNPLDRERLSEIVHTAAEAIRIITALLYPILPYATASVWRQLGLGDIEQAARNGELQNLQWRGLKPGTKLGPLAPVFPRADKGLVQIMNDMESPKPVEPIACVTGPNDPPSAQNQSVPSVSSVSGLSSAPDAGPRTATLAEPNPGAHVAASAAVTTERPGTPSHTEAHASGIFAAQPADASPQITIDDFAKIELRVAEVVIAERIPKADKLLRLEVDLGYERRQILSGIAEWYTPEELIGRRIVVIANLAPRKMRGLESHGMLLAASTEGGKPHLATFTGAESLPLGSRLR